MVHAANPVHVVLQVSRASLEKQVEGESPEMRQLRPGKEHPDIEADLVKLDSEEHWDCLAKMVR